MKSSRLRGRKFGGFVAALVGCSMLQPGATQSFDASFFKNCAFVCIDIQEEARSKVTSIPAEWEKTGYTVADCQAAVDFLHDVAIPSARNVADGCRSLGLPMIFVKWGCFFKDGMDLEPRIRRSFVAAQGDHPEKWTPLAAVTQPAKGLGVREDEYVLSKTGQDAFISSNIAFVLENLGVKNIVFVGGHTNPGGCLGQTAKSARERGYKILCVEDATFDAGESTRKKGIDSVPFDHVVTAEQFVRLVEQAKAR